MAVPIAIDPTRTFNGPFHCTKLSLHDGTTGFVVTRAGRTDEDSELYFVPPCPEDSELICGYITALLNVMAEQFPEVAALQVMA